MSQLCIQTYGYQQSSQNHLKWWCEVSYHEKHQSFFQEYFEECIKLADPGQGFQLHHGNSGFYFCHQDPARTSHILGQDRALWLSKGHHPPLVSRIRVLDSRIPLSKDSRTFPVHFSFVPPQGSWEDTTSPGRKTEAPRGLQLGCLNVTTELRGKAKMTQSSGS